MNRPLLISAILAVSMPGFSGASAQEPNIPPLGIIDFYGLRTIPEERVRTLLPFSEGDVPSVEQIRSLGPDLEAALGVHQVQVSPVCCDPSGLSMLYIGIAEQAGSGHGYRKPPSGEAGLPPEIMSSAEQFDEALEEAVMSGQFRDDHSEGHSLMEFPPARAVQQQFILQAEQHARELRQVLYESGNAQHRAIAAMVLAYSGDKAAIIPDLAHAALDPDDEVRNNATRALFVIASYARDHPELGISIQPDPYIQMLSSIDFGDRNKGVMLLSVLSESLEPELLDQLKSRALPALVEMCRWQSWGHAWSACVILQRIVGLPGKIGQEDRVKILDLVSELAAN